jgi:nucleolar GTP-binding protein
VYTGPHILRSQELLDKALHRASKITRSGKTHEQRQRETTTARIRSASDTLAKDLAAYVKGFPSLGKLHPFYRDLLPALLDVDRLRHAIGAADWASTSILRVARESVRSIGRAEPGEILRRKRAAFGRITSVVNQIEGELETLAHGAATLRLIPAIDVTLPTLVIAGAPNVGKSALVRRLSSGKPLVAPYAFTTKELSVGHFDDDPIRYQVLDTPGLLDRPPEARNDIERKAAAALRHVAHVIVFLLDPTETCGTTLEDQERLLQRIRDEFSDVPLLVIENKGDLLSGDSGRKRVSALTGAGVAALAKVATTTARRRAAAVSE